MFAEDFTGQGYANRGFLGLRQRLILPVLDDFDIQRWAKAQ